MRLFSKKYCKLIIATLSVSFLLVGCGNDNSGKNLFKNSEETTDSETETTVASTEEKTTTESITTTETTEAKAPYSDSLQIDVAEGSASTTMFEMDTVIGITVYGENAEKNVRETADLIDAMEGIFSTERTDSELYYLNQNGKAAVSDDLLDVVSKGQEFYEETDGAFNIALYPLISEWGFMNLSSEEHHVPADEKIQELLALAKPDAAKILELPETDWPNVGPNGTGPDEDGLAIMYGIEYELDGMKLDLGGIAKGYTADKAADYLINEEDVTGAMVSLGGNIMFVGSKPEGKPWKVGIQNPVGEVGDYVAVISVDPLTSGDDILPMSVVTAGTYERYFEVDGKRYHHIIDPSTGYPADTGILSLTIVSSNSTEADALSTALFVKGYDYAVDMWRSGKYDFDMVIIDSDLKIYYTEGLEGHFTTDLSSEKISY